MKIAIPLTDTNGFSSHYGGSAKFAVYDVDPARRVVQRRSIVTPSEAEPCAWPPLLHAEGVTVVLAGGMGRGAQQNMLNNGVEVVIGVPPAEPDVLVAAYLAGEIRSGVNACEGEGSHAHDHGHHHEGGNCQCAH
jgi:predicted Fe-Mo cluster-binding NifX family protein